MMTYDRSIPLRLKLARRALACLPRHEREAALEWIWDDYRQQSMRRNLSQDPSSAEEIAELARTEALLWQALAKRNGEATVMSLAIGMADAFVASGKHWGLEISGALKWIGPSAVVEHHGRHDVSPPPEIRCAYLSLLPPEAFGENARRPCVCVAFRVLNLPETARETVTNMHELENLDNRSFSVRQRGVTISLSAKGKTGKTEHYPCADLTFDELADMLTDHCVGDKDETGWTPFDFRDHIQESCNAIGADVAVLDIDDGTSLDIIEAALKKAGIGAIVASTYSHMSERIGLRQGKFAAWRKANPNAADEGFMRDQRKGYVEAVWRGSKIVRGRDGEPETKSVWNPKTKKNDEKITVRHAPCEKYRIIVLLAKPFFSDDHDDPDSAWETIVLSLAGSLKLRTDPQTLDRGRLFFGPRHPAGVRPAKRLVPGKPFDAERALARAREAVAGRGRDSDGTRHGEPQARQSRSGVKVFAGNIEALRSGMMAVPHDANIDMYDWIAGIGPSAKRLTVPTKGRTLRMIGRRLGSAVTTMTRPKGPGGVLCGTSERI